MCIERAPSPQRAHTPTPDHIKNAHEGVVDADELDLGVVERGAHHQAADAAKAFFCFVFSRGEGSVSKRAL